MMNENVLAKLKILAESAKYDVSCSSSGTVRSNKPERWETLWEDGDMPQFCRGRSMYLAIENHAYQLLHLRLCLLRQPS